MSSKRSGPLAQPHQCSSMGIRVVPSAVKPLSAAERPPDFHRLPEMPTADHKTTIASSAIQFLSDIRRAKTGYNSLGVSPLGQIYRLSPPPGKDCPGIGK